MCGRGGINRKTATRSAPWQAQEEALSLGGHGLILTTASRQPESLAVVLGTLASPQLDQHGGTADRFMVFSGSGTHALWSQGRRPHGHRFAA